MFDWDWETADRDAAIETVEQHRQIIAALLRRDRRTARKALTHHIRHNYVALTKMSLREEADTHR